MREIKIRAWDKKNKKWLDGNEWAFDPETSKGWYLEFGEMMDEIEDIVIVQYTGLKDKNGKEIWEGDLIQNEDGRICEVIWFQNYGQWDAFVKKIIKHDSASGFSPEEWWHCIEIIGNIYENPELLKSKKEAK
jgi:uncharacterized phage protein (TIGR01671 family)